MKPVHLILGRIYTMKKLLTLLLVLSLTTALFAGCGNDSATTSGDQATVTQKQGSEEATKAQAKDEQVELRIVTMFGGTDPATQAFEGQLEAFMADHPNVTIKNESMTAVGDEFRTKVKTDFATGNEADINFFFTGADVEAIIDQKRVVALSEIQASYPDIAKDVSQGVLDSVRVGDGEVYAIPMTGFYEGLFVNKALFDQYGLELPTTWGNLEKAIEVFNENGIVPFAGPIAQSHYMIEHFIYATAGAKGHQNVLDGDVPQSWVDGLNNIKALYDANAFSADALSMDIELAQILFRNEQAAMILEGSWFIGGCEDDLKDKMTVLPMPAAPGGAKDPSSIVGGFSSGYYLSRAAFEDSAKREAAVALLDYLTTADAIREIAQANGGSPSAPVVVEGLPQVAVDGHAMAANAKALSMPIDSRLTPEAFNYIVKDGVPFIAFGERTAVEVLEEVKKIQNK